MTEEIEFIESDSIGKSTLEVISEADKFNRWMYNTIKPDLKGNVLEIGSGIGNFSAFCLEDNYKIMLSDIRKGYCSDLKDKFDNHPGLMGVELLDLVDPDFENKFSKYLQQFDSIFALNVVEHIHDDTLALKNCHKLLAPGGKLIVLVPSYQNLFNQFDTGLGHYRRYNISTLSEVFLKSDFRITDKKYFNFIGMFGWYFSGNILKKKTIPSGQMKLYNQLVPVFKIIDKIILNSMGLSTIVVGEKQHATG